MASHVLAIVGNSMLATGYVLHLVAWHSVTRPGGHRFPWLWSVAIAAVSVVGALGLWLTR
jgi:hypothetical protein